MLGLPKMKALVIAPQPFFTPRGTPFSVYYRTEVMAELGVDIDLLTYGEGADVDIPGVRIIRIPRFAFLGGVPVGPSGLKIFLDLFLIIWTVALLLRERYDFVHAHEEAVFFCRFLKPLFGFKLVYDMHSSLPQQLRNFQFTRSRALIGLFKKLEDSCLRAADAVITICPHLADHVQSLIPGLVGHILIENSIFDPVRIVSKDGGTRGQELKTGTNEQTFESIRGKRLVVYAGTLEPYQGIDILIKAFGHVKAKEPDARLLIAGGNEAQVARYSSLAGRLGIENQCIFTGRVPQSTAKRYTRLASVLVSSRSEGTNTPLKVYELLASGIPLVATRIRSHTQVLNSSVAFLVEPEPEDMARGILAALEGDGEASRIRGNAVRLYREKYSRPVYVGKMKRLLERLS
jgi:glycosyltransferase involved in cell wall biosynthesis